MSVLIVGSLAFDDVKTPYGEVSGAVGGSATYASLAASLFADARIVGIVGEDFVPHLEFLKKKNICTRGVKVIKDGKTFHWSGYYEGDMSQAFTTSTCLNVFEIFKPTLSDDYRKSEYVLLGNIQPELQLHVLDQLESPKLVATDTMNFWIKSVPDKVKEVFARTDVILINDAEARLLCKTDNLPSAAHEMLSWGSKWVVVKKGEHGCSLFGNDLFFACPAFPLTDVKDPTGAGDSFAGGMLGWLAHVGTSDDDTLKQSIAVGTTIASFNVQNFSIENLKSLDTIQLSDRCEQLRKYITISEISM